MLAVNGKNTENNSFILFFSVFSVIHLYYYIIFFPACSKLNSLYFYFYFTLLTVPLMRNCQINHWTCWKGLERRGKRLILQCEQASQMSRHTFNLVACCPVGPVLAYIIFFFSISIIWIEKI